MLPFTTTNRQFLAYPILAVCLISYASRAAADEARAVTPAEFKHLKYRAIGPAAGGRICRVTGVPGDPRTYYAATAAGGVWKSSDGGTAWKPVTDELNVSSIGSIAVALSNPNIVYAGAGEANIRGDVVVGNGIYKSSDGGKHWLHVWKQEGQIGTMIVHPANPDIAFAAVLGHAFGPNKERGVYRTSDGGKHWQQVLYKDTHTGASDVCFDPSNPQVLFAGLWQALRQPWALTSGGPGSGLYVSRDGGDSWKLLGPGTAEDPVEPAPGRGLPKGPWGKIGVAVAPSDSRRVYALIEADKGGLYRSDDGGDSWALVSADPSLRQRAWYYSTLTVDPANANTVWCPQVSLMRSIDGGKTFRPVRGPRHGDHHDLWIDPRDSKRLINGDDGGVDISIDGGESWSSPLLPISQFYHVAADTRTPYHVSGAMQDLGTASGPSNSLSSGGISRADWIDVGGGESGFTAPDPTDPFIIYAGSYGGYITRFDERTRQRQNVTVYPVPAVGKSGAELEYRFQWTAPILVSPHNGKVVYHASNVLFETRDGGRSWHAVSPDLTRNDKSKQQWTGGPITGDNTGAEIYCTIFAVAESPRQQGLLWAGTDDGLVHLTRDDGKHWDNVTANIHGLPEWGTITCIEASPFEAGAAYVVVDAHRLDDMHPYLFKTDDYGKTWKSLSATLPQGVYLHALREDPKRRGQLYLGTDEGVQFSTDDGATWKPLKLNLPTSPVHDLVVKDNDLVIATHGRSLWILDDLTPLRSLSPQLAAQEVFLLPIMDAVRWRYHQGGGRDAAGENPPNGAIIDYHLNKKPNGDVTMDILDAHGAKVATLSSKKEAAGSGGDEEEGFRRRGGGQAIPAPEAGVNRLVWDLTYAGPKRIPGAMGWPPAPMTGPLVNPGVYTIKLTVAGKTQSQPLLVRADPRLHVSQADLDEQLHLALKIRDDISRLSEMVKEIRSVKEQLNAKLALWKENPRAKELSKQGRDLIEKLDALEGKLHNPKAKIVYDLLAQRGGAQLYSQLSYLLGTVMESDNAPTQGVRTLYAQESKRLHELDGRLTELLSGELKKLNESARQLGIADIVVPAAAQEKDSASKTP